MKSQEAKIMISISFECVFSSHMCEALFLLIFQIFKNCFGITIGKSRNFEVQRLSMSLITKNGLLQNLSRIMKIQDMSQLAKLKLHHCIENLESKLKFLMGLLEHQVVQQGQFFEIFHQKKIFPNRSRINLGWFLDLQGIKKHPFECIGSFRNP